LAAVLVGRWRNINNTALKTHNGAISEYHVRLKLYHGSILDFLGISIGRLRKRS